MKKLNVSKGREKRKRNDNYINKSRTHHIALMLYEARQDVILFHFLRRRATFLNLTLFRDKGGARKRERGRETVAYRAVS